MVNWIEYTDLEWRGLKFADLNVDEAFLHDTSNFHTWLYTFSEECYNCPFSAIKKHQYVQSLNNKHKSIKIDVSHPISIKVFNYDVGPYAFGNETSLCEFSSLKLGEFGVYNLSVSSNGSCSFVVDKEPVNIYLPLLLVGILLLLIGVLIKGFLYAYKLYNVRNSNNIMEENVENEEEEKKTKKRLRSLDTFRGMSIVLMIFVNSGGGHYYWIEHAPWNGLHIADIVFPAFLWIMGVCIPISIKSQINRGFPKTKILKNIFARSIKLFIIGVCLNSVNGPNLENLRIMGVLQRFGIAYLITASLHTICVKSQGIASQGRLQIIFYDIISMKFEWLYGLTSILIYLIILFGISAPGCPRGYVGPGGKYDMALHENCTGGIIGYIDRKILTEKHIYQNSKAKQIYDSLSLDPEGVFGCITTVIQVLIGLQCGITLLVFTEWKSRIKRWLIWSFALGLIGGILCLFSIENGWIPINKNLWSLSFVCVTSCLAYLILTICYYIIDVQNLWNGSPFREAGMNSIIMYVGHMVLHKILPWHWRIGNMNTHFVLLLESIWNTSLWIGISLYLYKVKIFYNL